MPLRRLVRARVEPVPPKRREVDSADVGDAIVDQHDLLVMAVQRPLPRVELHLDACPTRQLVAHLAHLAAVGMKERQWRSRPREHAHVDAHGSVGKQLAERRAAVAHSERRREEPSRDMHVRLRRSDVVDHAGQYLGAVDEELDLRARSRSKRAGLRPAARRRIERARVAAPAQPAPVMREDRVLDRGADRCIEAIER